MESRLPSAVASTFGRIATLADTSLSANERALLDQFASELRGRLGNQLDAVWLFGSRARGEPSDGEDSDVDVLVLVDDASWDGQQRVHAALDEAARALDLENLAAYFSVHIRTPEWLAQRRAIQSFFIAEIDREKIVVSSRGMSPRTAEFLETARRRLSAAAAAFEDDPSSALSLAYYSMLYAARAALSERDAYARTHAGTWSEFRRVFVETSEFDRELAGEAQKTQPKREAADYEAWLAPKNEALRVIELSRTFLAATEELIETGAER